jgi:hypothetical protein
MKSWNNVELEVGMEVVYISPTYNSGAAYRWMVVTKINPKMVQIAPIKMRGLGVKLNTWPDKLLVNVPTAA